MLKTVTITGADDSVQPFDLFNTSLEYGFVEFGILLSPSKRGVPRYPSDEWLKSLANMKDAEDGELVKLSLHLCGKYVYNLLLHGETHFIDDLKKIHPLLWDSFTRVQINTGGQRIQFDKLQAFIDGNPDKEFILQLDGDYENEKSARGIAINNYNEKENKYGNVSLLYDGSHGRGIAEGERKSPMFSGIRTGYAGGISPDNVGGELKKITRIVGRADWYDSQALGFWIDMESGVRENILGDSVLDMGKVHQVLDACDAHMRQHLPVGPGTSIHIPEPEEQSEGDMVAEFHRKFQHPILDTPQIPPRQRADLRYNLIAEELNEFMEAYLAGDIVGVADAMCDLQYVLFGAILEFGLAEKFGELFAEVHRSNMSKACATREEAEQTIKAVLESSQHLEDPTMEIEEREGLFFVYRQRDRKSIKSINYSPADIEGILAKTEE